MAEHFDEQKPYSGAPADADRPAEPVTTLRWYQQEDWLAVALGGAILAAAFLALWLSSGSGSAATHPAKD